MESLSKRIQHRRPVIIAASLALTLIIVLITTPYIIQSRLTKLLLESGAQEASVADVNFNPFKGEMQIADLRFSSLKAADQKITKLSVDLNLLSLFKRRIHFENIAVDGINLTVELDKSGRVLLGGLTIAVDEQKNSRKQKAGRPWGLGVDTVALSQIDINYRDPRVESLLSLEHLQVADLATWNSMRESPLKLKAKLNDSVIEFDGETRPFAKVPSFSGKAMLRQIELSPFVLLMPALEGLTGQLFLDSTIEVVAHADRSIELTHTGDFTLKQLKLQTAEIEVTQEQLQWRGKLGLTLKEGQFHPTMDAQLKLRATQVTAGATHLAAVGALATKIKFDTLKRITLAENAIQNVVLAKGLYRPAKGQPQSLLTIAKATIPHIELKAMSQLQLDEVALVDLVAMIGRNKEGIWIPATLTQSIPKQATAAGSRSETGATEDLHRAQETTAIKIGRLTLSGDSHVLFDDRAVTPPYLADLTLKEVEIGRLDSTQPDAPSPVRLLAAVDQYSEISVKGTISPFAAKPTLDLNNTVKALPLSRLSSYTVPLMGYTLISGQLDGAADVKMGRGKIDGEIRLTLKGLEVASADTEESKKMDTKLSIPLTTALNMLRDKNRTIKLTIPVSGASDRPDFDPSDAINTAIAKAMNKGAMGYLISSLQPYGSLISLARIAGEAVLKVRLNPILFEAASTAIDGESRDYLLKVARLMAERPQLNIKVCGVAVEADHKVLLAAAVAAASAERETLEKERPIWQPAPEPPVLTGPTISDKQLLELATARVVTIKEILITELEADATHLIDCRPSINRDAIDNPPRVELLI